MEGVACLPPHASVMGSSTLPEAPKGILYKKEKKKSHIKISSTNKYTYISRTERMWSSCSVSVQREVTGHGGTWGREVLHHLTGGVTDGDSFDAADIFAHDAG